MIAGLRRQVTGGQENSSVLARRILWPSPAPCFGEMNGLVPRFLRWPGQAWLGFGKVDRGGGSVVRCDKRFLDL